jgi:hypothetical protein
LLAAEPEFHERYVPVKVDIRDLEYVPLIYFNKYSDKVGMGISTSESTVTVPGFLLTGDRAVAQPRADGTLVASIDGGAAQVTFRVERGLTHASLEVRTSNPSAIHSEVSQNGNSVTVTVRSQSSQRAEIEEVILRTR